MRLAGSKMVYATTETVCAFGADIVRVVSQVPRKTRCSLIVCECRYKAHYPMAMDCTINTRTAYCSVMQEVKTVDLNSSHLQDRIFCTQEQALRHPLRQLIHLVQSPKGDRNNEMTPLSYHRSVLSPCSTREYNSEDDQCH